MQTFGNLQAKLFPIYFKVLTASLSVVLVVYAAKHAADGPRATASATKYQLAALGGAAVFTLANLLALGAPCAWPGAYLRNLLLLAQLGHLHWAYKAPFALSSCLALGIPPTKCYMGDCA